MPPSSSSIQPAVTVSEKTPKPKTTTAEIRQPKTPPPSAKVVSIIVISKPSGARLYVDGTDNGETPALLSLSSGKPRATLMLKLEGYHEINRVVNLELARMLKKKRLVVTLKRRASRKKTKKPPKIW